MNVKLFGYSISLNVIILIAILYLIMVVNAITCSCNEGFKRSSRRRSKFKFRKPSLSDMDDLETQDFSRSLNSLRKKMKFKRK